MKTFELIIKLRDTYETGRVHRAQLQALNMDDLLFRVRENLDGKFFAISAYMGGTLSVHTTYTVIINTSEVRDIVISEVAE